MKRLVISVMISGIIISGVGLAEWAAGRNLVGPEYPWMEFSGFFRTNGPFEDAISYSTIARCTYLSFFT